MTKKEHEKELRCYPAALTAAEVGDPAGQHQDRIQADKRKVPSGGKGRQRESHCQIAAH